MYPHLPANLPTIYYSTDKPPVKGVFWAAEATLYCLSWLIRIPP